MLSGCFSVTPGDVLAVCNVYCKQVKPQGLTLFACAVIMPEGAVDTSTAHGTAAGTKQDEGSAKHRGPRERPPLPTRGVELRSNLMRATVPGWAEGKASGRMRR